MTLSCRGQQVRVCAWSEALESEALLARGGRPNVHMDDPLFVAEVAVGHGHGWRVLALPGDENLPDRCIHARGRRAQGGPSSSGAWGVLAKGRGEGMPERVSATRRTWRGFGARPQRSVLVGGHARVVGTRVGDVAGVQSVSATGRM